MKISALVHNKFLSDITVSQMQGEKEEQFVAHRLVLATQSEIFKHIIEEHQLVEKIVIPKPMASTKKLDHMKDQQEISQSSDHLANILKLVYLSIEEPDSVREEVVKLVNKNNCFSYYSICLALGFQKLKGYFEEYIVSHISKDDDSMNLLFDSIQYQSEGMKQSALDTIVPKFSDFLRNQYLFNEIINLPFDAFKSLIQRDDICVNEESDVFNIVYKYILKREVNKTIFQSYSYQNLKQNTIFSRIYLNHLQNLLSVNNKDKQIISDIFNSHFPLSSNISFSIQMQQLYYFKNNQQKSDPEPPHQELKTNEEKPQQENKQEKSQSEGRNAEKVETPKSEVKTKSEKDPKSDEEPKPEEDGEPEKEEEGKKDEESPQTEEVVKGEGEDEKKEEPIAKGDQLVVKSEEKKGEEATEIKQGDEKVYFMDDNLEQIGKQRLQNYKLTVDQKKELLLSLRLGYISHEHLLKYSNIDHLSDFKDIFLQAISSKLNFYDTQEFLNKYQFNLDPRQSYADRVNNLSQVYPNNNNNNNSKLNTNSINQKRNPSVSQQFANFDKNGNMILNESLKSENTLPIKGNKPFQNQNKNQGLLQESNRSNSNNPYLLVDSKYQNNNSNNIPYPGKSDINLPSINTFVQNIGQQQSQKYHQQNQQQQYQQYDHQQLPIHQSLYQASLQSGLIRPPQNNNNNNKMMIQSGPDFAATNQNGQNMSSQLRQPNTISKQNKQNPEFVYKYDMDDNGCLYFLGTQGKSKQYVNPHVLGQALAFASTVRAGKIEYFIGREIQNLSTCNEKMSFMGVDIGEDRYLYPTAYTIRNRNSSTYVLLNWVLEASADGTHYIPIDKRIHYDPNDSHFNYTTERQRESLKERGATSSFAIDESSLRRVLADNQLQAFRYFRIVQISKNSHGSDNLSLSGFELYGLSYGNGWY